MKTVKTEGFEINLITGEQLLNVVIAAMKVLMPSYDKIIDFERQNTEAELWRLKNSANMETNLAAEQFCQSQRPEILTPAQLWAISARLTDSFLELPKYPMEKEMLMFDQKQRRNFDDPLKFALLGIEYKPGDENLLLSFPWRMNY